MKQKVFVVMVIMILLPIITYSQSIIGNWESGIKEGEYGVSEKRKIIIKSNNTFEDRQILYSYGKLHTEYIKKGNWKIKNNELNFESKVCHVYDAANNRTEIDSKSSYKTVYTVFKFENKNILIFVDENNNEWLRLIRN